MRGFEGECAHFSLNNCPIYTHDNASTKYSTDSQEADNSVPGISAPVIKTMHFINLFILSKLFVIV